MWKAIFIFGFVLLGITSSGCLGEDTTPKTVAPTPAPAPTITLTLSPTPTSTTTPPLTPTPLLKRLNVVTEVFNNNVDAAAAAGLERTGRGQAFENGYYYVVEWQGDKYVALNGKIGKLVKLIREDGKILRKDGTVYIEKKTITVDDIWDVGDGWTLMAQSIDAKASPREARLVLSKDGIKKDDKVISEKSIYTYVEKSIGGESDVPLFVTYVDSVFAGATSDMMQFRYTWVISPEILAPSSTPESPLIPKVGETPQAPKQLPTLKLVEVEEDPFKVGYLKDNYEYYEGMPVRVKSYPLGVGVIFVNEGKSGEIEIKAEMELDGKPSGVSLSKKFYVEPGKGYTLNFDSYIPPKEDQFDSIEYVIKITSPSGINVKHRIEGSRRNSYKARIDDITIGEKKIEKSAEEVNPLFLSVMERSQGAVVGEVKTMKAEDVLKNVLAVKDRTLSALSTDEINSFYSKLSKLLGVTVTANTGLYIITEGNIESFSGLGWQKIDEMMVVFPASEEMVNQKVYEGGALVKFELIRRTDDSTVGMLNVFKIS